MKFSVLTIFPQMVEETLKEGLVGQAFRKGILQLELVNPRQYTSDNHKTVDDRPFGGGDGMTLLAKPLADAIDNIRKESPEDSKLVKVIYLSPQGPLLNHQKVRELAQLEHLIFVCGRYGGVDQRFLNTYVDEELSIGDYVLSGGELAAGVAIDAIARQVPGVLGHAQSASQDSLSEDLMGLLECPQFTRPQEILGQKVPEIFAGGHHAKIEEFRRQVSILVTYQKRPELLRSAGLAGAILKSAAQFFEQLLESEKEALGLKLSISDLEKLRSGLFERL